MNINNRVKVKLTEYGKQAWKKKLKSEYNDFVYDITSADIDKNEYKYFQLWELMNIFGEAMYCGNTEICFEHNEIIMETETT